MRRHPLKVALLAAAGALITACGSSSNVTTTFRRAASPQDRAISAGKSFLKTYVNGDGRVFRPDQGNDTVGEGQAYGMLIAAAIKDRRRFDLIWAWTQQNLRRPDGLISFLWKGGHVIDPQAASDADLDASRALLIASCRFNNPGYKQQAIQLANAIMKVEVGHYGGGPVLTAGPWAITPPPMTINPSYFAPASFTDLRAATGDAAWGSLAQTSRSLTSTLMPITPSLPPDWAILQGDRPVPVGNPNNHAAPPRFSFDAVRTLVRFAEDPNPEGQRIAARAWPAFESGDPRNLPVERDLSGRPAGNTKSPVVQVAAAGAAHAAGQTAARDGLLDDAEALNSRFPTYYGAAWVALGRMMLTTKLLQTC